MEQVLSFCYNIHNIKAIVLGADPGNFSDNGNTVQIKVAFGIGSGDSRYFDAILKNLECICLSLKDVYVQNLITIDPGKETSKNPDWENLANSHIQHRIAEFDKFDPHCKLPVLVTAERIARFLSFEELPKAESLYADIGFQPIPPSHNRLGRNLYPFFRHPKYSLQNDSWEGYRKVLYQLFSPSNVM